MRKTGDYRYAKNGSLRMRLAETLGCRISSDNKQQRSEIGDSGMLLIKVVNGTRGERCICRAAWRSRLIVFVGARCNLGFAGCIDILAERFQIGLRQLRR